MNKLFSAILIVCLAACFGACKKEVSAEKQFQQDTTAIRSFIVANNIPAIKDQSGVFYQIILPGSGNYTYNANTYVTVDYTGRLFNGDTFDSSKGTAAKFPLAGLIQGWKLGIPKIQKGGTIRLLIPSGLGYGSAGQGPIPENANLDFTIKLADLSNQ